MQPNCRKEAAWCFWGADRRAASGGRLPIAIPLFRRGLGEAFTRHAVALKLTTVFSVFLSKDCARWLALRRMY